MALDIIEQSCPCGCGQSVDQAHDPTTEGRWQVRLTDCWAGKALAEFHEAHDREEIGGRLVHLELLPEGESASDPLTFDPVRARAAYEELQARHGQA